MTAPVTDNAWQPAAPPLFRGETTAETAAIELAIGDTIVVAGARHTIEVVRRWLPARVLIITTTGARFARAVDETMARVVLA